MLWDLTTVQNAPPFTYKTSPKIKKTLHSWKIKVLKSKLTGISAFRIGSSVRISLRLPAQFRTWHRSRAACAPFRQAGGEPCIFGEPVASSEFGAPWIGGELFINQGFLSVLQWDSSEF